MRYTDTSRTFNLSLLVQCCISVNRPEQRYKIQQIDIVFNKGSGALLAFGIVNLAYMALY